MTPLRSFCLGSTFLIAGACASGAQVEDTGQTYRGAGGSLDSGVSSGGVYMLSGGSPGSGGGPRGPGGQSNSGGMTADGGMGPGGNSSSGGTGGGDPTDAGSGSGGSSEDDASMAGDGGAMGGDGGATGSGGAMNNCPQGQKFCAGNCFAPNPGIGCGLTGCTGCGAPPTNSFRKCTGEMCDFECNWGYKLNAAGDGCEVNPDAGPPPGSGGSQGAGGSGSGATCTPSDLSKCPICAGPQCCKPDGTCGCNTFWIPICG